MLFYRLHVHDNEMKKEGKKPENLMGISNDALKNRRRRNIITLSGHFLSFVVETTYVIIYVFLMEFDNSTHIHIFNSFFPALLVFTFFLSSPELRRFYFYN